MATVNEVLAANRAAVTALLAAGERSGPGWTVAPAPGKWSPSQIAEHIARSLDESANVVAGLPSKFPSIPAPFRPLVRAFLFNRVLKNNAFPKAKTSKPFNPASGPATVAEARVRLEAALARFDHECRAREAAGQRVASATFGTISIEDYAKFQEVHTRHHSKQIAGAAEQRV